MPPEERLRLIEETATEKGFTPHHDAQGRLDGIGDSRVKATDVIKALWQDKHGNAVVGEVAFRYFSAAAHGDHLGIAVQLDVSDTDEEKVTEALRIGHLRIRERDVPPRVGVALTSYLFAVDSLMRLFGWDAWEWGGWAEHTLRKLKAFTAQLESGSN